MVEIDIPAIEQCPNLGKGLRVVNEVDEKLILANEIGGK